MTPILPWIAHLYTASGAVIALLATGMTFAHNFRAVFIYFVAATFVDSTDASGKAERGVFVHSIPAAVTRDSIYLIATIQARKAGVAPKSDTTMILILRLTQP